MYNKFKLRSDKNAKPKKQYSKHQVKNYPCAYSLMSIVFMLILVPGFSSVVSAKDKPVFNVDFFCGWSGYYRPMEWTPLEITVTSSLEKAFDGELTVTSQQDGLNTLNIIHDFVLTQDLPEYIPLVTKIAFSAQKCNLKLNQKIGKRRKTVYSHDYDSWRLVSAGKSPVLNEQDMLIGIIGMGKFGLLGLEKQSISQFRGTRGNVCVGNKQASIVPWDWTGFVALDLLILYDPDWIELKEQKLKAIAEWVSNGGKMLLILGNKPLTGENPLMNIIPFDFMEAKQVNVPQQHLSEWGLAGNDSEMVIARSLVPKSNAKVVDGDIYQDKEYLFGVGNAGFGRVGVLAFDPADFSQFQTGYSSRFWVNLIQTILKSEDTAENTITAQRRIEFVMDKDTALNTPAISGRAGRGGQIAYPSNYYQIGSAYSQNNKVMEFLYAEIKPLSVWFVILLLGALAVLLGPVDYKFLKHIDRLPLTWLTCAFWIILFTVGAYYGVQNIRGGKMQLKVVSVLDGIKDSDTAWATHYSGLFASRSDSYQLEGIKPNQWWSGIAPTQDQIYSYNQELGSRNIYCVQEDGGNLPDALPVNIWDIQCMLTESPIEKLPFTAEVQRNGNDITVTINNESDIAIVSGYVLTGKNQGIDFAAILPHGNEKFQGQNRTLPYWENVNNYRNEAAFFAQGSLQRTQAMNNYLSKGAAVVCVVYDKAPVSFKVKDHSFSEEHVQLARLVVFPEGN